MPNPENLIGHEFTSDQDREKAAINGRKGGKASGEAKRRRKAMREAFDDLLSRKFKDRNGKDVQGIEAVAVKVFQKAMDGDLKAAQFIRDTVGEMPVQQVEIQAQIPQEVYDKVARVLDGGDVEQGQE